MNEGASLCRGHDPELWFAQGESGKKSPRKAEMIATAVAICNRCPIRAECLAFALEHDHRYGVWGGKTEEERAKMLLHPRQTGRPPKKPKRQPAGLPLPDPSTVRGVSWNTWKGRWVVIIRHDGKRRAGGSFRTREEAEARAIAEYTTLGQSTVRSRTGKKEVA